jgi:serine/threonine protein kinase
MTALFAGVGWSVLAAVLGVILANQFHGWFSWAVISFVEVPAGLIWFGINALGARGRDDAVRPAAAVEQGLPEIPDHELLHPFGKGSYGQVWLAKNILGTYRAVKIVFRAAFQHDSPFEREFRGIQAFEPVSRSHDGLVDILQVGRRDDAGYFFYVMELADDQNTGPQIDPARYAPKTLSSEIARRERIPCGECVTIAISLAGALQKLHESNLLHRDIKPSNIIFVGNTVKLADIGLVAHTAEAKSYVGTEGFVPPEGPGFPQADIYSLGKVLYEMAMGRDRCRFPELPTNLPENAEAKHLAALNKIILRACEEDCLQRYQSAQEMLSDLEGLGAQII